MSKKTKCSVRDGQFVEPCDLLKALTEFGNPIGKRKGIWSWQLCTTKGPTRTLFGAKSGEHVDNGFLFNFCPCCGERIDAPILAPVNGDPK